MAQAIPLASSRAGANPGIPDADWLLATAVPAQRPPGREQFVPTGPPGIQWPVGPRGHDCVLILKAWPANLLSLDHVNLQPPTKWNFDRRACHFAVAHSGMPIPHVELRSQHIYGKVDGVAGASLRRVHVAAESLRHDGTACLPARWCHADTTKERMQRNLHREI